MKNDLFENMPVHKAYLKLAIPVALSMMVCLAYNMADTYFIALTENANLIAGISLIAPIFTLLISIGDIMGLGGSALFSRLFGEKRFEDTRKVSSFSFWSCVVIGITIAILLIVFKQPILTFLGADEGTWQYAEEYYFWLAIGSPAIILSFVPGNFLRTEGRGKNFLIGSIIGSVSNIILDPIFIFTLGYGAAGAGMATGIANVLADAYYIYFIITKSQVISVSLKENMVAFSTVKSILAIGIPAAFTNMMQSFMVAVTNIFLLPFGSEAIAAMGIALKLNMVSALILIGLSFGGLPLIGYNYGSGNKKRLKEAIAFAFKFNVGCALLFSAIMIIFAPEIIRSFIDNDVIVEHGITMLIYLQSSLIFMTAALVTTCICQALGNGQGAMILSICRQGIVFAVMIYVLFSIFGYKGILAAQPAADIITAVIAVTIMKKMIDKIKLST